jgi:hypothetical protein
MRSIIYSSVLLLATAGCLRSTAYKCSSNDQCGAGGVCESTEYCSYADPDCGRRYGSQSGALANQCVGSNPMIDASTLVDTPQGGSDGSGSGSADAAMGCPSDFMTITGGAPNRKYKLLATADTWINQKAACANQGTNTWLGFPENTGELTAMDTFAGNNNVYWIGISDLPPATTFVTVKGQTATFLPWEGGTPSSNPNDQCVEVLRQNATFLNDRCIHTFPAICSCE